MTKQDMDILAFFLSIITICTVYQSLALTRIEKLFKGEIKELRKMALDFTELAQDVTDLTTVETGVETVLYPCYRVYPYRIKGKKEKS